MHASRACKQARHKSWRISVALAGCGPEATARAAHAIPQRHAPPFRVSQVARHLARSRSTSSRRRTCVSGVLWFIACLLFFILCSTAPRLGMMLRRSLRPASLVFLCIFILFLLAGFNLEGNVETELPEALEQWATLVEAEKRAIEELPFVKSVAFHYGDTANLNKVIATVWCCWQPSRQSFMQVPMACHVELRPTFLEVTRALREKLLLEHGAADHEHDHRAVQRRAEPTPSTRRSCARSTLRCCCRRWAACRCRACARRGRWRRRR